MQIETKYNIGDEVWWMRGNVPQSGKVFWIDVQLKIYKKSTEQKEYYYIEKMLKDVACNIHESELFPTKQDLLNSL